MRNLFLMAMALAVCLASGAWAQEKKEATFDGLDMNLGTLPVLSNAESRSISAENFTGEKGKGGMATEGYGAKAARELGKGWKVSPAVDIEANTTFTLADINGPGAIQSIWITGGLTRYTILRFYWDGQEQPSVETPLPDFFASGWGPPAQINSIPVNVNPKNGYNCFWLMPFKKHCRITLENRSNDKISCYYQVNYTLTAVPDDMAYFHAQFRRVNPLPYKQDYTILDGVKGKGQYIGTYMTRQSNNNGWWGEGEIKFFMDDDNDFATIVGTGTEDYFGGSYNFDVEGKYTAYSGPFLGLPSVIQSDGSYKPHQRFGMYRWHVMDPIRFNSKLKVTIQSLGWRSGGRYLPLQDDISSVAYWYQTLPTTPFPALPDRDYLEIQ